MEVRKGIITTKLIFIYCMNISDSFNLSKKFNIFYKLTLSVNYETDKTSKII